MYGFKAAPSLIGVCVGHIRDLSVRMSRRVSWSRWSLSVLFWAAFASLSIGVRSANAYTVITLSTGTPSSVETSLIAAVTSQFNASVASNPFFPGTYTVKVFGINPVYNPPVTQKQLLDALVTVDSYTYVYGWANGLEYQNHVNEGITTNYLINCDTPTAFNLHQTAPENFDRKTCSDVLNSVLDSFYKLNLSTTPVILTGF